MRPTGFVAIERTRELTGFTIDHLRAGSGAPGDTRLISNFAIFPKHNFAVVNIEPGIKVVRFTADEMAQGSNRVREMPALYYFVGTPRTIYKTFLDTRQRKGYKFYQPKYEWFGGSPDFTRSRWAGLLPPPSHQ